MSCHLMEFLQVPLIPYPALFLMQVLGMANTNPLSTDLLLP